MLPSHYLHHLVSCSKFQTPSLGKKLHAQLIKLGLNLFGPLPNTLLSMYGKCGLLLPAMQLFDEMPHRNHISWTSVLTAHNHADRSRKALAIFPRMWKLDGLLPDHFIIASLVKACASSGNLRLGRQVHAHFLVSEYYHDDVVKSSLVDMYAKCAMLDAARLVFDSIGRKNAISWTAMLSGYARIGNRVAALELFRRMPVKNLLSWSALISGLASSGHSFDAFKIFSEMRGVGEAEGVDAFILSSLVAASANLATLELGKQVHCLVIILGYEYDLCVMNSLVDMYAKCSDILGARSIFDELPSRDVVSWTSMIVGTAQHGRAEEALALYDEMMKVADVKPNEVTFLGLIYACSHVGLVAKGKHLFTSMIEDYGIRPSLQHYTCLLDLLSRSGHLQEAEDLLESMPLEPDEAAWAALLSACNNNNNNNNNKQPPPPPKSRDIALRVADRMLGRLKPKDPSTYVLLSNTYAAASMWDKKSEVRRLMSDMDVRKEPGYSCIEMGKGNETFHAGEVSDCHPMKGELLDKLTELDQAIRKRGYVPDTRYVLHEMDEHEKERQLFWHSERLALAYGLLKSVPGMSIRIVKNLRICGDCHTVMKLISSVVGREIVIRDINRFHHFKDGRCSCGDFW